MLEFIVIVESSADYRIATDLATRIIVDKIEWIEPYLDNTFQWRGLQDVQRTHVGVILAKLEKK